MSEKDQRMEDLSDLVSRGISIDLLEALAVIEYQERLRKQRNIAGKAGGFWNKLKSLVGFSED